MQAPQSAFADFHAAQVDAGEKLPWRHFCANSSICASEHLLLGATWVGAVHLKSEPSGSAQVVGVVSGAPVSVTGAPVSTGAVSGEPVSAVSTGAGSLLQPVKAAALTTPAEKRREKAR